MYSPWLPWRVDLRSVPSQPHFCLTFNKCRRMCGRVSWVSHHYQRIAMSSVLGGSIPNILCPPETCSLRSTGGIGSIPTLLCMTSTCEDAVMLSMGAGPLDGCLHLFQLRHGARRGNVRLQLQGLVLVSEGEGGLCGIPHIT